MDIDLEALAELIAESKAVFRTQETKVAKDLLDDVKDYDSGYRSGYLDGLRYTLDGIEDCCD